MLQTILYILIGAGVIIYIVLSIVNLKKNKKAINKDKSKQKQELKNKERDDD